MQKLFLFISIPNFANKSLKVIKQFIAIQQEASHMGNTQTKAQSFQETNQHRGFSIQSRYNYKQNKVTDSKVDSQSYKLSKRLRQLDNSDSQKSQQSVFSKILGKQYELEKYFHQFFDKQATINHPRFIKLKYSNQEPQLMLLKYSTQQKQFQAWQQQLQLYQYRKQNKKTNQKEVQERYKNRINQNFEDVDSGFVFLPVTYNAISPNEAFCTDAIQTKLVNILFPKYPSQLLQQIFRRNQMDQFYDQEELWFALYSIVMAGLQLHQYGKKFWMGSIHPYNIFLNDQGKLIVMPWFGLPGNRNCFVKWAVTGCSQQFISPQCMGFIGKNQDEFGKRNFLQDGFPKCLSKHQCDSFAAGMTMLSMATIQPDMSRCYKRQEDSQLMASQRRTYGKSDISKSLYQSKLLRKQYLNQKNYTASERFASSINKGQIAALLRKVEKKYSKVFYFVIERLLDPNPQTRLDFFSLFQELLEPFQRQIISFNSEWMHAQTLNPQSQNKTPAKTQIIQSPIRNQKSQRLNISEEVRQRSNLYTLNNTQQKVSFQSGYLKQETIRQQNSNSQGRERKVFTYQISQNQKVINQSPTKFYGINNRSIQVYSGSPKTVTNSANKKTDSYAKEIPNKEGSFVSNNQKKIPSTNSPNIRFIYGQTKIEQSQQTRVRQDLFKRPENKLISFYGLNDSIIQTAGQPKISQQKKALRIDTSNVKNLNSSLNAAYPKIIYHSDNGKVPEGNQTNSAVKLKTNIRYLS